MSTPPVAPTSAFQERLITLLMPYFVTLAADYETARTEILETLASYGPRSRAELINAARIITLSFSSMEILAEATSSELQYPARLRACALGNSLNRTCQQDEKILAKRLTCDNAGANEYGTETMQDLANTAAEMGMGLMPAEIESCRNRLSGNRPAALPGLHTNPDQSPFGSPILNALTGSTPPARAAVRA